MKRQCGWGGNTPLAKAGVGARGGGAAWDPVGNPLSVQQREGMHGVSDEVRAAVPHGIRQ